MMLLLLLLSTRSHSRLGMTVWKRDSRSEQDRDMQMIKLPRMDVFPKQMWACTWCVDPSAGLRLFGQHTYTSSTHDEWGVLECGRCA